MSLPRRRWSKLQSRLYLLMIEDFQIHISLLRMQAEPIPRLWATLGKGEQQKVIFDYPHCETNTQERQNIKWRNHMEIFSQLICDYVNTSPDELISRTWPNDKYGLTDVFKACDRRIGYRRLQELNKALSNEQAKTIVQHRISNYKENGGNT